MEKRYSSDIPGPEGGEAGPSRPAAATYRVIAGHRRVIAAIKAAMVGVPAVVAEVDEQTRGLDGALVENLQRTQRTPTESRHFAPAQAATSPPNDEETRNVRFLSALASLQGRPSLAMRGSVATST